MILFLAFCLSILTSAIVFLFLENILKFARMKISALIIGALIGNFFGFGLFSITDLSSFESLAIFCVSGNLIGAFLGGLLSHNNSFYA